MPPRKSLFDKWFQRQVHPHHAHSIVVLGEVASKRAEVGDELLAAVRSHYLDPEYVKRLQHRFEDPSKILKYWQAKLPQTSRQRSGDFGEILASEYACQVLKYEIPIKRLRWKDGRDNAMRGDDLTALRHRNGTLIFLKGEVKSRAELGDATMKELADGLRRDAGVPGSFTLAFIAERLAQQPTSTATEALIELLLDAQVNGIAPARVSHLAFTVSGNPPIDAARGYLDKHCLSAFKQIVACVRLDGHATAIEEIYVGLNSASTA